MVKSVWSASIVTRRRLLLVLAVAAAAYFVWMYAGGSDQTKIRRRLDEMAKLASKAANEQPVESFGKARRLSEYFTEECQAADGSNGQVVSGRQEVVQAIFWAREQQEAATVSLKDVQVVVKDNANASAVITVGVTVPAGRESPYDGTRASLTLVKVKREWLISSAFVDRQAGEPGR